MSDIHQGEEIKRFTTEDGREVILRYPSWGDEEGMREFINTMSVEDTFITFSGEEVTEEDEKAYLTRMFDGMEEEDCILVIAVAQNKVIGTVSLERKTESKRRARHIATFGISVLSEFRGVGLGEEMAKTVFEEGAKYLSEIRMLVLSVYSLNVRAHKLYQKLGFQDYGRLPGGIWYRDEYVDEILMYREFTSSTQASG